MRVRRTKIIFIIEISIYLTITVHRFVSGIVTKRLEIHGHPGFDFHAVGVLFNKNQPGGEKLKQRRVEYVLTISLFQ